MNFHERLNTLIAEKHLLKHPFYRAWMKGELTPADLRDYAAQYFPHVAAFPRFVSAIHSSCENPSARKAIFMNLSEEEGQGQAEDHPELWLRFAEGLGAGRDQIQNAQILPKAQALVDRYFQLCRSSYAAGLGALVAYESQIPEIAQAKIEGLNRFYGITDSRTTQFFEIHKSADRFHSETCIRLLEELDDSDREIALQAAEKASNALWDFLTEVYQRTEIASQHGNQCLSEEAVCPAAL